MLTIGYGDVVATGVLSRVAEIAAGGTGVGVLALGVTYLFSLYGAFQRREELVTTLDARAGAPPSGIVMLETYARLGLWDDLRRSFADWEEWSARVLDTHVAYPILVYFRSSHDGESWVGAIGAVLDAAVLMATAVESGPNGQPVPRGQAVMTIKGGAHLVEDVGQFFGFSDDAIPLVERAEFDAACERIRRAGLTLRTDPDTSWKSFADLRATYASRLNKLAGYLLIPPAQWIGDRSPVRHVARVEQVFRFEADVEEAEVALLGRLKLETQPIAYLDGVPDAPSIPMEDAQPTVPSEGLARAGPRPAPRGSDRRLLAVQLRVGRRLDDAQRVDRPEAQPGAADHLAGLDHAELARVLRLGAVVAEHEEAAVRNGPLGDVGERHGIAVAVDVRLVQLHAVDEHAAVLDLHGVAGDADDALDERRLVVGVLAVGAGAGDVAALRDRRVEHHDVAAGVGVEARRQLVDQQVLVRQQRRLHGVHLDAVGLHHERLDDHVQDDREDDGGDDLHHGIKRVDRAGPLLRPRVSGLSWPIGGFVGSFPGSSMSDG